MQSPAQPPKLNNSRGDSYLAKGGERGHKPAAASDVHERSGYAPIGLRPDPLEGPPAPSWLQFFAMGSNARFTRTPDYLLRTDYDSPAAAGDSARLMPAASDIADALYREDRAAMETRLPPTVLPPPSLMPASVPSAAERQYVWREAPRQLSASGPASSEEADPPVAASPSSVARVTAPHVVDEGHETHKASEAYGTSATSAGEPWPDGVWDMSELEWPETDPFQVIDDEEPTETAAMPARVSRLKNLAEIIQIGLATLPRKSDLQDNDPDADKPCADSTAPAPAEAPPVRRPPPLIARRKGEPPAASSPAPTPAAAPIAPSVSVNVSFGWLPLTATPAAAPDVPAGGPEQGDAAEAPAVASLEDARPAVTVAIAAPTAEEPELPAALAAAPVAASEKVTEAATEPTPDARPAPRLLGTTFDLPSLELLTEPSASEPNLEHAEEVLEKNSVGLQQILHDFGIRGEIIDANPGPVVTLYELEPAPGTKSSRVIGLADDIARSMSAISARVAVVPGRNVIGIELPNKTRETVWLRELLASRDFETAQTKLGLCLGKTIGGEPIIVDLARMPHLLVAGTTGSGKSVAINTMILSLLYRHSPEACRLIMIDPKMLELSIYEGIPHLLTPVVTDPRKAVVALKWAVREMEDRYRKMSKLGVRNIDGFNARAVEARAQGTQDDFLDSDGEPIDMTPLPYIVVVVDEMADLMIVAGKDIEGAIQRLAQMARAAGIHLIMATQRPSVDVITGTIKANFPTRISFQVTSKIDSRTILGEQGAEQLLGQGDMLYMAGGGRLTRVHGPFVSDREVEKVVDHLKLQGRPDYLDAVTTSEEDEQPAPEAAAEGEDGAVFDKTGMGFGEEGGDLYDQAVMIVLRDKKASTSYIQRRLQIGYNRAASIMERMENEGIVGQANHAGKREILKEL
ncbi:DNA translocase FtsK [Chelatococcus asaccharovorans]|uniref:S-DNA-T family DNA segregation ATPase FtsK/SpoIIIE n=1 Tax=Chelatococcus asaccharovorans TaxID=28210 RepID=A0A2V3UIF1_9HYPH|nr:DNA translocase FtsK [Chelatococcus asaccharovorans]MBS7706540.1 DNA translocase FtsK [Chelatococcus asaccharovorans]PXW64813.1 S-DNA-T family DNA segregation ATPase FtsK/SpoIIIE [Chelatococcus asaccharovorans]